MHCIKMKRFLLFLAGCVLCTAGCRLKKDVNLEYDQNSAQDEELFRVELSVPELEYESIGLTLLGLSAEVLEDYHLSDDIAADGVDMYEYETQLLIIMHEQGLIEYEDEKNLAGSIYRSAVKVDFWEYTYLQERLRREHPEELESCSKEEALSFCDPIAKACGYSDSVVQTYAFSKDQLAGAGVGAPYSDYEYVSLNEIYDLRAQGREEEAGSASAKRNGNLYHGNVWEKEHEAILVVYRNRINDKVLDMGMDSLFLVYVPSYKKVMYAAGGYPSLVKEQTGEKASLTEKEAVEEFLVYLNDDSEDDIEILNVEMVYSYRRSSGGKGLEQRFADPCWRIDYRLGETFGSLRRAEDPGTVIIDAIDGHVLINE